jgi:cytochrome c556
MNRRTGLTIAGFLLALGIAFVIASSGQSADEDEDFIKDVKEARGEVIKLMDSMGKGGGKAEAAAIKKRFAELKPVMYAFKPRDKHGLGVGPEGKGDGIELKIIALGKRAPAKADVAKMKDDLIKMAVVSKAIAEVADLYPPKKDAAKWKQYDDEMRKGADELIEAAKSGDPAKIKAAANNLNASCTSCHADFRD